VQYSKEKCGGRKYTGFYTVIELHHTARLEYLRQRHSLTEVSRTALPENKESLKSDRTMREADARAKSRMKQYADKRPKAKPSSLQPGDIVMLKQRRTNKYSTHYQPIPYEEVARQGPMITARNERHDVTRNVSRFKRVNVKMEPPIESDMMEDHSMNNDVPIEVSEAEDSPTQSIVDQSRYPSGSTRNKQPVWMKDYVNK
jgi:hypothetical protein